MGVGPNFVLDKGFKATGSTAYRRGLLVSPINAGLDVALVTTPPTATTLSPTFVVMEDLDLIRLGLGKAFVNCRVLGIARVIAGGAIPLWSRVNPDATARAAAVTKAAAGSQPVPVAGIALTAATAAEQEIDMLLTPGGNW